MKATDHLLQFNKRVFRLHMGETEIENVAARSCQRCAFKNELDWCNKGQHSCSGVNADDNDGIWIEEPNWPAVAVVSTGRIPSSGESKPSNPKDIVGIRKAPLSCVPMNVVAEMGLGMLEGASKYGRHNFRAVGVRSSVYFDAAMRHLIAWWEGEDLDPDTGMSHVAKALACLAVLRDAQLQGLCTDDRPPRSAPFYDRLNVLAGQILDKHADKSPRHYTIEDTK